MLLTELFLLCMVELSILAFPNFLKRTLGILPPKQVSESRVWHQICDKMYQMMWKCEGPQNYQTAFPKKEHLSWSLKSRFQPLIYWGCIFSPPLLPKHQLCIRHGHFWCPRNFFLTPYVKGRRVNTLDFVGHIVISDNVLLFQKPFKNVKTILNSQAV